MNIKSFSPLKGNVVDYDLNTSDFGSEFFFSDNNSSLYIMILRYNGVNYEVISYQHILGNSNDVDFDYRIDMNNYIKIVHTDVKSNTYFTDVSNLMTIYNGSTTPCYFNKTRPFRTEMIEPSCYTYLLVNSSDFYDSYMNSGYITTQSNGNVIVPNLTNVLNNVNYNYNFNFYDYSNYLDYNNNNYSVPDTIYPGGFLPILLAPGASIGAIACYNDTNNFWFSYSSNNSGFSFNTLSTVYFWIPNDTTRIEFQIDGDIFTKYTVKYNISSQLFYFGVENPIDTIGFIGKTERLETNTKRIIDFGKRKRVVKYDISHKLQQNTGLFLADKDIFNLVKSPYILTIDAYSDLNGTFYSTGHLNIEEYILDDSTFEGFNTKTFSNKNIILNMTKKVSDRLYTAFDTSFFS